MNLVSVRTTALAVMMSSVMVLPAAVRADDAKSSPAASMSSANGQHDKNLHQYSEAGHTAMLNIGDARLAIFNGDPKAALKLMESAKSHLAIAAKEPAPANGITTGANSKSGAANATLLNMHLIPVDGRLSLADDFVMTPEKKGHVDKANESFKQGDQKSGLEELRLGAIDVNYTRWWLPLVPTEAHLDGAIKFANEGKFYEANLALKAIEDGVIMDSISFSDVAPSPKAAKNGG